MSLLAQTDDASVDLGHNGYPGLAKELMGKCMEAAIFSRYSDLSNLNLLIYQAEVAEFHEEFFGPNANRIAPTPAEDGPQLLQGPTCWRTLVDLKSKKGPQWSRVSDMRRILERYGKLTNFPAHVF
jgi:hypothetical protein